MQLNQAIYLGNDIMFENFRQYASEPALQSFVNQDVYAAFSAKEEEVAAAEMPADGKKDSSNHSALSFAAHQATSSNDQDWKVKSPHFEMQCPDLEDALISSGCIPVSAFYEVLAPKIPGTLFGCQLDNFS